MLAEFNATIVFYYCCMCTIAASVEILQKEVVVHKEMVAELRTQLAEKEQEFQVNWPWLCIHECTCTYTCTCITIVPCNRNRSRENYF